jgi:hypothetical protein
LFKYFSVLFSLKSTLAERCNFVLVFEASHVINKITHGSKGILIQGNGIIFLVSRQYGHSFIQLLLLAALFEIFATLKITTNPDVRLHANCRGVSNYMGRSFGKK